MFMSEDLFEDLRRQMLAEVVTEAVLTVGHTGQASFSERVLSVIGRMPRYEKTVSQPFIVALMTDLLDPDEDDVVLEIGAGAGYQAAILAELAKRVYTVDIIEELAQGAERRLKRLGYENVEVRVANGYYGWAEHAPYDKIMVTAAADLIPAPLLAQLKPGGRMVIPTGIPDKQTLILVEKSAAGSLSTREILPVRFSELEDPGRIAGAA
jgi:protein-L-isoaspartate(D-aspartate) O-methyltransferase